MDQLHAFEIVQLQRLQHVFAKYSESMLFFSQLGDPRSAFLVCVPLVYCFSRPAGLRVLWAAALSEWLNLVMKWLLNGQRPYWWVQESNFYENTSRPIIEQFSLTCETGPGAPSGHAMVTTAAWYTVMSSVATYLATTSQPANQKSRLARLYCLLPWSMLVLILCTVCISRVFIATHFVHQVLMGVFIGILIGRYLSSCRLESYPPSSHIAFAIFIAVATLLQTCILAAFHVDISWALKLAQRWCSHKEWIHLNTTPWYALARDIGSLSLVTLTEATVSTREIQSVPRKVTASVLGVVFAQIVEQVQIPSVNAGVFYTLGGLKYGLIVLGVVVIKRFICDANNKNH